MIVVVHVFAKNSGGRRHGGKKEEGERNGNGLLVGRFKDRRIRLNCSSNRRLGREASHGVTKRLEKLDVRPVKGIS